jgi:uncharacterized protein with HEPN domain
VSGDFLFNELIPVLMSLGEQKVLALVSDSAKNCLSVRKKINNAFPHILSISCNVHSLNLICERLFKIKELSDIFLKAIQVISAFNSSNKLTAELQSINELLGKKNKSLERAANTRFSTRYKCLETLALNEEALVIIGESAPNISNHVKETLKNEIFWANCKNILEIIKPIYEMIKLSESSQFRLSDSYVGLMATVYRCKKACDQSRIGRKIMGEILNIFNCRMKMMVQDDIYITATYLDMRYNYIKWSSMARKRIIDRLLLFIGNYGAAVEEKAAIQQQFLKFNPYMHQKCNNSSNFWKMPDIVKQYPNLAIAAVYLDSIVPHSMSCERAFSVFGILNSPRRSTMSLNNLSMTVKLYLNFREKINTAKSDTNISLSDLFSAEIDLLEETANEIVYDSEMDAFDDTPLTVLLEEMQERINMNIDEFDMFIEEDSVSPSLLITSSIHSALNCSVLN